MNRKSWDGPCFPSKLLKEDKQIDFEMFGEISDRSFTHRYIQIVEVTL